MGRHGDLTLRRFEIVGHLSVGALENMPFLNVGAHFENVGPFEIEVMR